LTARSAEPIFPAMVVRATFERFIVFDFNL
jgi:hypothetical protein